MQRFPLAALVRVRQQTEASAERALAAANVALATEQLRLRELESLLHAQQELRRKEVGLALSAAHHQAMAGTWAALRSEVQRQHGVLLQLELRCRETQEHFFAARRQHEIVKELETTWHREEAALASRSEQRRLDDVASLRLRARRAARFADKH